MVAILSPLASATIPPSVIAGRGTLVQFTVDDVLSMIEHGTLRDDSTELLNGFIVKIDRSETNGDSAIHSPGHRKAVRHLTNLLSRIDSAERNIQIQSSIICGPNQMPEPDFAIVIGDDDSYTNRLPTGSDVMCVIEVSDSSLERDRYEKGPMYAAAGIPQYIILNLRNRTAELYSDPAATTGTYPSPRIVAADASIDLRIGDGETLAIPLAQLLP